MISAAAKMVEEQGFRACLGILRFEKSYSAQRLEAASTAATTSARPARARSRRS
jgi:hypothetical protein